MRDREQILAGFYADIERLESTIASPDFDPESEEGYRACAEKFAAECAILCIVHFWPQIEEMADLEAAYGRV